MASLTLHLSEEARLVAERRAEQEGFTSIDAYVEALVFEDAGQQVEKLDGPLAAILRRRLEGQDVDASTDEVRAMMDRVRKQVGVPTRGSLGNRP